MKTIERVKAEMIINRDTRYNISFPGQMSARLGISASYACKLMRELMRDGFCSQRYPYGPYEVIK